jgi:lipopolysaccharide export system permease protein
VIISRYLTREVLNTLLAVTVVLLLAFLSQQLVRYMNYVAIGKIPTDLLLKLVSFEVPYLLAVLLPVGLYLGVLLAYGRLYADNEMAILQMSGYNNARVLRLTTLIAFFVALIILALMLWVNPQVSAMRQQLMNSGETTVRLIQSIIPGRFQASPDGSHVMYVEKLSRDRMRAQNIFLAQQKKVSGADKQNTWSLVVANQGYQEKDKNSPDQLFVTEDGYRYEGVPGQNDYKITQFKKYYVRIPQNTVTSSHAENESLSSSQLLQQYDNPKRAAELQWRVSMAMSAFLLALLAVPLSSVRPRQGKYLVLLPAILIYIVYANLLWIARRWVEQGVTPVAIGMWWVHGLMLLLIFIAIFFNATFRKS